jgi:hypothetical protein
VKGALLFSWNAINLLSGPPVGGEKCSRCNRLSGDAGVEGGGQVGAEVDGVEDEMRGWGWNDVQGGAGAVTGVRVGICVGDGVCASWGGVQVGFASWGGQVTGWSRWGVKIGVCRSDVVNSWFPLFDGVSLPTTSRRIQTGGGIET